jgi:4-amino-4-deoxy-L-arabinose transferase-like glycosyltransferase
MAADILVALFFTLGLFVFSYGVGRPLVAVFGADGPTGLRNLDRSLITLALGFGAITAVYLFIGLGDALTEPAAWAVYAVAGAITVAQYRVLYAEAQGVVTRLRPLRPPLWAIALAAVIAVHAFLNLVGAMAPPSMADPLRHHLASPAYYADVGGFPFVPVIFWNLPGVLHVDYTVELLLASDIAPAVTHFAFSLLTGAAVFALGRRFAGWRVGLVGSAIFYSLPMTTELAASPMVEMGAAFFAVLSVYALITAVKEGKAKGTNGEKTIGLRWILLAGLLGGLAGATKTWALLAGPAGLAVIVVVQGTGVFRNPRQTAYSFALFSFAFGLILGPWLIRNFIAAGDPLWPIGYQVFHGDLWTDWHFDKFSAWETGPGKSVIDFVLGPWNLTNDIGSFNQDRGPLSGALLTPILLIFIPAAWLFRSGRDRVSGALLAALAAFVVLAYIVWFAGYQQPRYIQVVHPLLAILAGVGVVAAGGVGRRWFALASKGLLALSLVGTLGVGVAFNSSFFPVVFGAESREEFLNEKVSNISSITWVNQNLPADAKVLVMGLAGWYYLDRDWLVGDSAYQGHLAYHDLSDPQGLETELRELGITHVLVQGALDADPTLLGWAARVGGPEYRSRGLVELLADLGAEPATPNDFEARPFVLLAGLEANGKLALAHTGEENVVKSRTFGGSETVRFLVYELVEGEN